MRFEPCPEHIVRFEPSSEIIKKNIEKKGFLRALNEMVLTINSLINTENRIEYYSEVKKDTIEKKQKQRKAKIVILKKEIEKKILTRSEFKRLNEMVCHQIITRSKKKKL